MRSAKPSLKARALRYLSAREHSRLELVRKLARYAEETDDIEALLDWLETSKFLSSTRFAESLINRRAERFGASRILMELESHQIDLSGMTELSMQLREGEGERAWRVWEKKFGTPAETAIESSKQQRFLQQRGFSHASIQMVMRRARKGGDGE